MELLTTDSARSGFFAGFRPVTPLMEAYQPHDVDAYKRTLALYERHSLREAMDSDDLPYILAGSTDTILRETYGSVAQPWRDAFKVTSFPNFRQQTLADLLEIETDDQAGNAARNNLIPKVPEGHGYDEARISEVVEKATLATYGITFSYSRYMLENDDRRAIERIPASLGRTMARTINAKVVEVLEAGATTSVSGQVMNDTGRLFNDTAVTSAGGHANLVSGSHALAQATLKAQLVAFGAQKTPSGLKLNQLGIRAKYLIVPAALELTARELVSNAALIGASGTIVTSENLLTYLRVVVIPELTSDVDWYLAADPMDYPTVEVAYLRGNQSPSLFVQSTDLANLSNADGMKHKIRHDFVAYAAGWAGMRKVDVTG